MRFSETVKLVAPELVVSRRHDAWLAENDHLRYSPEALDFAITQLTARDRERKGTVSASSLGECSRYQQFVYLGLPKLPPEPRQALKMANGAFMHLRWQMAGLTEGWLREAEVPVSAEVPRLVGTMDGILYEDSILELKSINNHGYSRVTTFGPLSEHLFQMATYVLCSGRHRGVFIYENKDNQEYVEIAVHPDDLPLPLARERAMQVWASIEDQVLFEPLSKCLEQTGWRYNSCPFRDRCLGIRTWEDAL